MRFNICYNEGASHGGEQSFFNNFWTVEAQGPASLLQAVVILVTHHLDFITIQRKNNIPLHVI